MGNDTIGRGRLFCKFTTRNKKGDSLRSGTRFPWLAWSCGVAAFDFISRVALAGAWLWMLSLPNPALLTWS